MRLWLRPLLLLAALLLAQAVPAQTLLQRLVTPGPLAMPHAKLEASCESCHESFSREAQNGKCVACHKGVGADIARHGGFHGKSPQARAGACKTCHSDHHGRPAALVHFNKAGFSHDTLTDYRLQGGHEKLACASCHKPGAKFRNTPSNCASCHAAKDPHKGKLGKNCEGCHSEAGWKQTRPFDHGTTGYNLVGGHRSVACLACHVGQRWAETPRACVACHLKDDTHKGSRGPRCESCHSPARWKQANFDHAVFPLVGRHATATCASCHGAGNSLPKPPRDCIGCHRKDDTHKGLNGTACSKCHNSSDWKQTRFNHDTMTRFALHGKHRSAKCEACHRQPAQQVKPPSDCYGCHAQDDTHALKFGKACETCHAESGWKDQVRFDHSLTRFPLLGKHVPLTCNACHSDKKFTAKGIACTACHSDEHHAGTLGKTPDCARCHTVNGWKAWHFDHDRDTRFALVGKHQGLICSACHVRVGDPRKTPNTCYACHREDDRHEGGFGRNCARCHTSREWGEIIM